MNITEELDELNVRYFKLYGDVAENKSFLPEDVRGEMQAALFRAYAIEAELLVQPFENAHFTEVYRQERLKEELTPRTWRRFLRKRRNRAENVLQCEVAQEAGELFDAREQACAERAQSKAQSEEAPGEASECESADGRAAEFPSNSSFRRDRGSSDTGDIGAKARTGV